MSDERWSWAEFADGVIQAIKWGLVILFGVVWFLTWGPANV